MSKAATPITNADFVAIRRRHTTLEFFRKRIIHLLKNNYLCNMLHIGGIIHCRNCRHTWPDHEEKMTDVNIATEMLVDSFEDRCDTTLLISADSDIVPAIRGIKRLFPAKRIVVFFPPGRLSAQLKFVADKQFTIGRATLAKSLFPDQIIKPDGHVLVRPEKWR